MLYRIGTTKEIPALPCQLPDRVRTEIFQGLVVLDCEYGQDRDYLSSGGYSLIAEISEDIPKLKEIIDYDTQTCEWATQIGNTGYLSALFILNNDFSIMAYMPRTIAPESIINELED